MQRERSIYHEASLTLLGVGFVCAAVFLVTFVLDGLRAVSSRGVFDLFRDLDRESALNILGSMGEVIAAVLGVAITVVSIVLQLAANRYTPKVVDLFFRAPVNLVVMPLFVVGAFHAMWVGFSLRHDSVPRWGVGLAMFFLSASLVVLFPYFVYMFHFLRPDMIIGRIGREMTGRLARLGTAAERVRVRACGELFASVEQLSEIALNAVANRDKSIAIRAIETLREVAAAHGAAKAEARLTAEQGAALFLRDPDLVSMPAEVSGGLVRNNVWLEMKVLRQFQTLFENALGNLADVNYYIAMQTKELGIGAVARHDEPLANLATRFFNTYLRASINAASVRTAYNVLYQYRLYGERLVEAGDAERVREIMGYFKYYGLLCLNRQLPFILETAAYDICSLLERVDEAGMAEERELLAIFLQVDREYEGDEKPFEESLRGVRKAQVKLAAFYLGRGRDDLARLIFEDMKQESKVRLGSIRKELASVKDRYFWEIIDRGVNLDYLTPEQAIHLDRFFSWFE